MNTPKPTFVREVARIDDPQFVSGQAAGHRARRLIDAPDAAFADPFVLMAEDWTSQGAFAFHPHRGIETVTFVIEGAIEHRDSAGFGGVIHAGGAQWMTAGRGVQHEENPPAGTTAHTLQLWVNLPAAEKMAVPRNQDLEVSALPVRSENGVEIRVFSGAYGGPDTGHWRHLADLSAIGQSTVGGADSLSVPVCNSSPPLSHGQRGRVFISRSCRPPLCPDFVLLRIVRNRDAQISVATHQ